MKKSLTAMLAASAIVLSFGLVTAHAQESVPASAAENGNLWFVELAGNPTADGNNIKNVKAEKAAFKKNAAAAGVSFKERRSFDVLFNGYSVEVAPGQLAKLHSVPGVKATWPVEVIQAPESEPSGGSAPDLAYAIAMTGADIAQNSLGYTGAGVKVAIMDTGIDYHHPDLGGGFGPGFRVVTGWDFVGDAFDANSGNSTYNPIPEPDPDPDDCGGHGTHVAGIVGADGTVTGVAPSVTFGAYRVFGCVGSTSADIMISAMERALADGMDVLNMSIGSAFQWPQYPTAAAADRAVNKGMIIVASAGNEGTSGLYASGAPGIGKKVIGTASIDNTHVSQLAFTANPGGLLMGFNTATGAPPPPASGTLTLSAIAPVIGCDAGDFAGFPAGDAALVSRGTCSFHIKAVNAQNAGAAAVVLYNNAAGTVNPTVVGATPITIPFVAITQADGLTLASLIPGATITWGTQTVVGPSPTGGLISSFSSYGLAANLSLKPDIAAPGGSIYSTIPVEQGSYGNKSGTSMASPHVAGAAALVLQAKPHTNSQVMRTILQNSADPTVWSGNPGLGFLDNVHRQGAGMVDIDDAILATTKVEPGKIAAGEGEAGPYAQMLRIENSGSSGVTYDLSYVNALSTGGVITPSFFLSDASVAFSASSVTITAGGSASVLATITPATGPEFGQYGGYIVLTPQGGGQVYRVPFAGFVGDYQGIVVLQPTGNGFPWLATLDGGSYWGEPDGATYTMEGDNIPFFLVHIDHQPRRMEFQVIHAGSGKPVHPVFSNFDEFDYFGRNSTTTSFFAFAWDGTRMHDNGRGTPDHRKVVPNGKYKVVLKVLKALGDASNPAHWESWTSPEITLARP